MVNASWECSTLILFVCRTGLIVFAYHIRVSVKVIKAQSALIIRKEDGGGEKAAFLLS